jgi:hypothetical protein
MSSSLIIAGIIILSLRGAANNSLAALPEDAAAV